MSSPSFKNLVDNLPGSDGDGDGDSHAVKTGFLPGNFLLANHDFQSTVLAALTDLHGKVPGADPSHLNNLSSMSNGLSLETGKAVIGDSGDNTGSPGVKTGGAI
jgi:hypothetical protein